MKKFISYKFKYAFTLIELIISITILSIIMLSVFGIYSNIVAANKKIELSRILQENSKNIIESIAKDIREKGIDFSYYNPLTGNMDYTGSGNSILAIKGGLQYLRKKDTVTGSIKCNNSDTSCYLWRSDDKKISNDSVEIKSMKYYISGVENTNITNEDREGKVTIIFELSVLPGKGMSSSITKDSSIKVQTTISEKIYKN